MRRAWSDAARVAEVREAARAWRDAGAIDAATLETIEAAYPEPRPRLSPAWKALIFFLLTVALNAVFFGFLSVTRIESAGIVLFFGALLVAAAEWLRGSRFAGNGSDASASFWAIVYLLFGLGWLYSQGKPNEEAMVTLLLASAVALFAAACVRWGFAAYGTLAAVALFGFLARLPGGRAWWLIAGAALLALAYRSLDRSALAPPHRNAAAGAFAVAAIALYLAANRCSVDFQWIEALRANGSSSGRVPEGLRLLSSAATALLPVAFVAWGLRARRTLILDLGLVFAAASLVTLRFYVHLAPVWLLLVLAGAALVLGSLWLNRWLRTGSGGERAGFSAAPLFSGRRESLQAAAVVAGFTGPAAHAPATAAPTPPSGDLSTGGGRFGGGGASGEF